MPFLAYPAIFGLVNKDPENPCTERRAAFESIEALDDRHPSILHHFLGDIPIGDMSHRHADECAVVYAHQFLKGTFMTLAKPSDELLLIRGQPLTRGRR